MPRSVDSSDLDRLGDNLRQEMRETTAAILERMDASAAETRRHFDRFRGEVREGFKKVDRRLLRLEVRVIGRSDLT